MWRPIPGWQESYEVSDAGEVRSVDRTIVAPTPQGGLAVRRYKGRILRPGTTKKGYVTVTLTASDRPRHTAYVHDLVLAAFVGPKPIGLETCHNNGRRSDNRRENLRYDTRSANQLDRHRHGTFDSIPRGEACASAKLAEADVKWARRSARKLTQRDMAAILGVSHSAIGAAVRGDQWAHVQQEQP